MRALVDDTRRYSRDRRNRPSDDKHVWPFQKSERKKLAPHRVKYARFRWKTFAARLYTSAFTEIRLACLFIFLING